VKAMNTWDAEPLWRLFERWGVDVRTMTPYPIAGPPRSESPPEPAPTGRATAGEADMTPWSVEKARNRLARSVEKIESRRWMPKLPYQLTGQAVKKVQEAHELLHEAGQALLRKE
jgi:uncharacterized iron-regulated membrane protein